MNLIAAFIFAIGSVICHQKPDRSFFWDGHQFPVCARCSGIYLSAAAGFVVWIGFKFGMRWRTIGVRPEVALRIAAIAAVPTAVSVAAGALGVWDGTNVTRAVLAVPLGATAGAMVAAVASKDLR